MPARRKPTAVLIASGAFERHPERRRAREHEPVSNEPVGDPPAYFDDDLRSIWDELKADAPLDVLHMSDRIVLEMSVLLLKKYRSAPKSMPAWLERLGEVLRKKGCTASAVKKMQESIFKSLCMSASEIRVLMRCLGCMGMNPKHRLT